MLPGVALETLSNSWEPPVSAQLEPTGLSSLKFHLSQSSLLEMFNLSRGSCFCTDAGLTGVSSWV